MEKPRQVRVRVAVIIKNENGKILLIRQKKRNREYWLLPGGGVEFGESASFALERELKEELGINLKNISFILLNESIDPGGRLHIIQLIFKAESMDVPKIPESEGVVLGFDYFSPEEIKPLEIRPDIKKYLLSGEFKESIFIKSEWITD